MTTVATSNPTGSHTTVTDPTTTTAPRRTLPDRPPPAPIPFARIVSVEARKSFDTRSGLWLLASIGLLCAAATAAVVLFSPGDPTFGSFAQAIGIPMAVILPVVAILAVTAEWSQRTGLATFTLVPDRSRVVRAKAVVAVTVGVVSMLVAFGVGAVGNLVASAVSGTDAVWDIPVGVLATILLANVLGLLVGFMLGVLVRSTPGAIVGYFVYSLVLPGILAVLAASQAWFRDIQPWTDFNYAQTRLYDGGLSALEWSQIGVTGAVWLLAPLTLGVWLVLRSEVK